MQTPTISRVFAAWLIIPIASHAAENLLTNPSAQGGATDGWTIIASGGDGWATRGDSADGDGISFIASFDWCTRSQTIDLLAAGYSQAYLDSSPPIQVRESFKGFNNVADNYFLRVELRDAGGAVLDSWEAGTQAAPLIANGTWLAEEHRFENYPAGVRQIYWEDGGNDTEYWAGHWGTLLDAAELSFADPAPTAINLTPGTYPVSAPLGGVAGVLSTVDNAGSSHRYALVNQTQATALVATGSLWSYLDDGTDQGTAWREVVFADGTWPTGNAELGFGEGDEATAIAGFESHYTNYFRHRFNIAPGGLVGIEGLTLRLKRDDGAVVYLNGTEIARDNLPVGDIFFDTPTSGAASDDGANFHAFDVPPGLLVEGENVLAVEIHQTNLTTSDASFDLELLASETADAFDNALFTVDGDRLLFAQTGPSVPVTIGGTWMVNVQTTDDAGNVFVQLLTVTGVEDPTQAPTAIALSPDFTTEALPAGTVVGQLTATDGDAGDLHTFALVAGAGSDDNALFQIMSDDLVTAAVLDAATQPNLSVRVRATDRAGLSVEQALSVEVLDVNDPPTEIEFTGTSILTSDPAGTLVGRLSTVDADVGETHTYSFVPAFGSEPVFGFGSEWRFLDDGSDLGAANWKDTGAGFDDSAWKSGVGSFGYGDAQVTEVGFGADEANKYVTTYFRRTFNLANPPAYLDYELQVLRDDGVAVYLNGVEVGLDGLNSNPAATDLAAPTIGGVDETTPVNFAVASGMFAAGTNTLAVEVHQAAINSSDLTFDLALSGTTDESGAAYFEIANGNEIRANTNFDNADVAPGTMLGLVIRSTDARGASIDRSFSVAVFSDDPNDRDGDGLPDPWEQLYFTSIAGQDADDDSDKDGQTEGDELVFGTIPNDPSSRFGITIESAGPGSHRVQWSSDASRRYRLQTSTTLERGSWSDTAAGQRQGTGAMMGETVPDAGAPIQHFRVVVEIP